MLQSKVWRYFILGLLIAAILVWQAVFGQALSSQLAVYFFDVGQGDAIFLETPAHQQILIDGGPDKTILEKLNQTMPFYDRTIDLIILTHTDLDHLTGLVSVLEHFQVSQILWAGVGQENAAFQKWQGMIKEKNIPIAIARAGQKIIFSDNSEIDIFWPDQARIQSFLKDNNNLSVVAKLIYGETEIFLAGDIGRPVEQILLTQNQNLAADILKVAHHGSKNSSAENFIKAVAPEIAIISVGQDNRYGHPHPETLDRLKSATIYRTDQSGDIEILTDGQIINCLAKK